jgi:hypothetical protein
LGTSPRNNHHTAKTAAGTPWVGLSDEDMLQCRLALPEPQQNKQRIQILKDAPVQRWLVLQETITWAEAQPTAKRNTPQKCLELQNARLAQNDPQTGLARSRPEHDT